MKILFSDNALWGLLNFRSGVINHFIILGHQVVLVAPADSICDLSLIPKGATFIPVELSRTGTNPLNDLKYYKALKAIYKSEQPDYIFHYTIKPNIYGTLAAKSLKIKSSAMIAGLGHVYTKEGSVANKIARVMYKYAMQFPEKVFVLNQSNREILLSRKVVEPTKIILLEGGEGINLDKFMPLPMPSNKKLVFLMICRVLYDKGYAQYVESARALHRKATFKLMGPIDSNPAAVKRETIESDVRDGLIEYIEFSPNVQSQIATADCVVLPSSYGEGLSRVLMEGLALARPIIATDIAGCRETVHEGENGFLCKPKDAESLKICLSKFIDLTLQERQSMAVKSRQLAEDVFDEQKIIDQFERIISNAQQL